MNKELDVLKKVAISIVEHFCTKEEPARTNNINKILNTDEFKCINKKLKSIEIIKEKRVDVSWLMKCFGFIENSTNEEECDYYNNNYEAYRNSKPLTQEEYDLLKEVLL